MNVRELIEKLRAMDPEAVVMVSDTSHQFGDTIYAAAHEPDAGFTDAHCDAFRFPDEGRGPYSPTYYQDRATRLTVPAILIA